MACHDEKATINEQMNVQVPAMHPSLQDEECEDDDNYENDEEEYEENDNYEEEFDD